MSQPFRFRRFPQALALAIAASSALLSVAEAADLRQRLNVRQDVSEIVLGETMYNFYQGDQFAALNNLVYAKHTKKIDESNTTAEILLGDLYTLFGMPEDADTVFSRIMSRDMRSQTRNVTSFRKARLQYQRGDYFEAERALNSPLDTQITELEAERRVLLANVLMARNEFNDARELLAPIPLDTQLGIYATYNTGVAHLRAGHFLEGINLLEQVMNLPVSDHETNALKDRAALAMGYSYLQNKQSDKAREVLLNVRLKGPFSNAALLALGYANFEREEYKRALSFWLELIARNPGDPSVQEAMILAPRAYEALKAEQQAFYGYKLAINNLNDQIKAVDTLAAKVKTATWLDNISPVTEDVTNADPMSVPASIVPADSTEVSLLYGLFAAHGFNEGFQQYEQLKRLKRLLDRRSQELLALKEVADNLSSRKSRLNTASTQISALQSRVGLVSGRWLTLEKRARQAATSNNTASLSSRGGSNIQNMERQFKLGQAENRLAKLPQSPQRQALENRVRMLKGLVMMDIASKVPPSRERIYADITSIDTQLRLTQTRLEAVKQLLADNKKITSADNAGEIRRLQAGIQTSQKALDKALDEYRTYLRALAEIQLEDTRNRINNDLAEAHLSIARLQDAALARDGSKAATSGK